jgi:NAD(P)H-hydrate epimerase
MSLIDVTDTPLSPLPPRHPDSHKGDYGRALLVGGSRGMAGAIALAGRATLRSGAGLVTLAVPQSVQDVVASFEPSYMTLGLADESGQIAPEAADRVIELAENATVVALGPGLGRGEGLWDFVERLYREIKQPLVVDADALYALARRSAAYCSPPAPRVLTPHPGEFGPLATALTGKWDAAMSAKTGDDKFRRMGADCLAKQDPSGHTVIVLKGSRTVIADGKCVSTNNTGNPGMATGGSGDVLTGVITGLLCQGLAPFDATRLAVHVHGLAGDLAAKEFGQVSLIASDLIEYLPKAFMQLTSS